nr:QueT transporter family protein [bacterium]
MTNKPIQGWVLRLVRGAMIAAIYAALTLLLKPISYGMIQLRFSEALTVLPALWVEAVPGLAVGCLIANVLGGMGIWDIVLGTLATLLAALTTRALRKKTALVPLPPVLFNAVIVGTMLGILLAQPVALCILYVGIGQVLACYGLGLPLYIKLAKSPLGQDNRP